MTATDTTTVQGIQVPPGWTLPVENFDPQTGKLNIVEGTIEVLEDINGLERGTITDDIFGYVLMAWDNHHCEAGDPPHALMGKLEHAREIRTLH